MAASFVFDGTVRRVARPARGRPRTARVRVDAIVRAPAFLADLAGRVVEVEDCDVRSRSGERARFYATPVMFGDVMVVRAERQTAVPASRRARPKAPGASIARLRRRLAAADVVVSGQVTTIRRSTPVGRIGEHEPVWRDALIRVAAVHKGRGVGRVLCVRFPAGTDVAWARAPKLRLRQRGVFLLKRTGATFTALDPADVQPASVIL
ncbi:MAG TPA: hypothetical protein VLT86_08805 [Vicinamibacterales bacterium]|nr:hypothetical protein [Vicinamibacterales bacterium]